LSKEWEGGSSNHPILLLVYIVGRRIEQQPNFPSRLKNGKEDRVAAQFFFSSKDWERVLGGCSIFLIVYNEWVGESGNHMSLLQAYKQRKCNPNTQNLIEVNYQG
jgi:hypothetical protein